MSASVGNQINTRGASSGYSGVEEHSAPLHAFLEYSTCLIYPVLFGLNLHWAGTHLYTYEFVWLIVLAIPIGLVGGDFISGVVHWAADTYCSEDTPIVGPSLVKPFRRHHLYPRDICTHNLVETVGNVCILAVPVLALCLYLLWLFPEASWMAFAAFCIALMSAATVATNQFHKWAHSENPPAFARPLQRMRLVLEPAHHELHHTAPYESHYCITNGWLNPLLNKIKFFRRLEYALGLVGIKTAEVIDLQKAQRSASRSNANC